VISHDRYFMDKITDHLFVFEGGGKIVDITGNYSNYRLEQRKVKSSPVVSEKPKEVKQAPEKKRLSYKEQIEFKQLETDISALEAEKEILSIKLSEAGISNEDLVRLGETIGKVVQQLDEKTNRWLELAELA